jgi:uncharacterized membrane protein YczE
MKVRSHHSSAKRCLGFINHEGLVVGFVCAVLAAIMLALARKTEASWLGVIGALIMLLGVFAIFNDFVVTFQHSRRRRSKKGSEKHDDVA